MFMSANRDSRQDIQIQTTKLTIIVTQINSSQMRVSYLARPRMMYDRVT